MARKKQSSGSSPNSPNFQTNWLNLNDTERQEMAEIVSYSLGDGFNRIGEFAREGWKISVSYSPNHDSLFLSLTPKEVKDFAKNEVYIFQHRNPDRLDQFLVYFFDFMLVSGHRLLTPQVDDLDW